MSDHTDAAVIGERIARAREELGLTQADVATVVGGLDRTAVAKIEAGRRKVSAGELVRFAAALDRSIDWFVSEAPPAVVSRRNDPAAGGQSKKLDRVVEQLARDVDYLEREGILPDVATQRLEMPRTYEEAERAATEVRQWMDVDVGPLTDLQGRCETLGLLAFSLSLGEEGRDASYVSIDRWGVAAINGDADPGRRRFNLAHEFGHHVFADAYAPEVTISPGSETERLVNAFAVHLLLPREPVEETWASFDDKRVAAVAVGVRFRASWSAVTSHLKNLGMIGDAERFALAHDPPTAADFIELGERWVSELEPPSVPPEYGRRVVSAYRSGRLTRERTTELLHGTVREAELPERRHVPLEGLRREFEELH